MDHVSLVNSIYMIFLVVIIIIVIITILLMGAQVEAISQLAMFAENLVDYHRQCTEIMEGLVNTLNDKYVLYLVYGGAGQHS